MFDGPWSWMTWNSISMFALSWRGVDGRSAFIASTGDAAGRLQKPAPASGGRISRVIPAGDFQQQIDKVDRTKLLIWTACEERIDQQHQQTIARRRSGVCHAGN